MKKLRVVVIGIDGATWNLIKPWAEEGKLPTFKKFIEELKRVYRILKPGGYAVIPMENLAS